MSNQPNGLHLIGGEKGGMGKSLFSMTLLEYLHERNCDYLLIDADRSSPDVGQTYEPDHYQDSTNQKYQPNNQHKRIFFSEDEEDSFLADDLIDLACETITIVNLPAQVSDILDIWLNKRQALEVAKELNLDIYLWFCSDGSPESISILKRSLAAYQDSPITHILVANLGLSKEASRNLLERAGNLSLIEFPRLLLSLKARNWLKENKVKLRDAVAVEQYTKFGRLNKKRVYDFLKSTFHSIDQTQVFPRQSGEKNND